MARTTILYDNQDITRIGLEAFLKQSRKQTKVIIVEHKQTLVNALCVNADAVVVIDYTLSDLNSSDALLNIAARFPHVHWILFSDELSFQFIKKIIINNEAFSVLLKHCSKQEIELATKLAYDNTRYICTQIAELLSERKNEINTHKEKLTLTEIEILKDIVLGNSAKQIASKRNISVHTIVTHRKNIYRKLQINTVQEAFMYAMRAGIVDVADYSI